MNTVEHLRDLFTYNDWANKRLVAALRKQKCDRARQLLAHLLITQKEYFERLSGKDSTGFDFFPELSVDQCELLSDETSHRFLALLESTDENGLDRLTGYKTSEGVAYQNTYRELLTHVLLHSSIHRGNIMLKLRESGIGPPKIDFIIYLREQTAAIR